LDTWLDDHKNIHSIQLKKEKQKRYFCQIMKVGKKLYLMRKAWHVAGNISVLLSETSSPEILYDKFEKFKYLFSETSPTS
jgi:hypothetical protein